MGKKSFTGEQIQVIEALTGIGPDVLCKEFLEAYDIAIYAAIIENERRLGRSSEVRSAANHSSLNVLVMLLKLHPRPFQEFENTERRSMVSPLQLAKLIQADVPRRLQTEQSQNIIGDVLAIFGGAASIGAVTTALVTDGDVHRPLTTVKAGIMKAVKPLAALGLVEIVPGKRGLSQKVTVGLALTEQGMKFMTMLWRHSITSSANRHPAFDTDHEPGESHD